MEQTREHQTSNAERFGLISEPQALSTHENPLKNKNFLVPFGIMSSNHLASSLKSPAVLFCPLSTLRDVTDDKLAQNLRRIVMESSSMSANKKLTPVQLARGVYNLHFLKI
ncbi:hypothetical protein DPMN_014080 [Dreissena polymorpha]|uniref:Uncharacterized protein n=1 Tax=Dreissena polymorpha TaxID=45954 RepID=A0A9D4N5C9_DREPO|nr:hypothetical protein DPMN_014080 [Dreissena polymorpha]